MLVELWRLASVYGAAHTDDWLTLSAGDIVGLAGRKRYADSELAFRKLCASVEYETRYVGASIEIKVRNFAKKQNLTPRSPVVSAEETTRLRRLPVPVPTPHSKEEDIAPAALVLEAEDAPPADQVSAQEIIEAWRRICVPRGAPDLREITGERKRKLRQRLREHPTFGWWDEVFRRMAQSRFLFGNGKTGWRASFDWLVANDTNAVKILEGKYDDQANKNGAARR